MKRFFGALAAAAILLAPAASQAQIDNSVVVTVNSNPYSVGGKGYPGQNGGGFLADFSVDFPAPTGTLSFTNYLIWCIDAGRSVSLGVPVEYKLYTLADFGSTGVNGANPDEDAMTRIASLQNQIVQNWGDGVTPFGDLQGSIWSWFDGYANYGNDAGLGPILPGNPAFNVSEYYVLWNGTDQTFLTKISEPSSVLLAFAGMGAFLVAVRRRRIN